MLGTCHCDRCHELEERIRANPELARRMLEQIERQARLVAAAQNYMGPAR